MTENNNLSLLLKLSEVDTQIEELLDANKTVPSVMKELERRIAALESEIRSAENKKTDLETAQRDSETFVREKKEWIVSREEQVKDLKTNKEYHAALKEVSVAKKEISDRELHVTALAGEIENATRRAEEIRASHAPQIEAYQVKIEEQKKILEDMKPRLDEKERERGGIAVEVDAKLVALYNQVRQKVSPAISKAENFVCTECGSRIQPQLYNRLFNAGEMHRCQRCKRLLYVVPADKVEPATK